MKPFILTLTLLAAACGTSPTAPTAAVQTPTSVKLTVSTFIYQTTTPLGGTAVYINDNLAGQTDDTGQFVTTAMVGATLTIRVSHDGYTALLPWASSDVGPGPETWTFWLQH